MKIIKDDLKFLMFSEIYLKLDEPKAKRKALSILEAAIQCFAKKGFDDVTAEMIARSAGVSRALISHYFKNVEEVQTYALKYIRVVYQKIVVDAMSAQKRPDEMLKAYAAASLMWVENMRSHALVGFAYLQRCGRDPKKRVLNTQAVKAGSDRLAALLEMGKAHGIFKCGDSQKAAKAIQVLITGGVTSLCSEDLEATEFIDEIQANCLALANI